MSELFKKVYIHTEADLPKEEGRYFYHHKKADRIECSSYLMNWDDEYWMAHIDWYLLPVPEVSDEEIDKKTERYIGICGSPMRTIQFRETFKQGAKWIQEKMGGEK